MENFLQFILSQIDIFLLIIVRVSGVFIISPVLGRNNLPALLKIGLSGLVAFMLLPITENQVMVDSSNFLEFSIYITQEFLIGIMIGFIAFTYFSVLYLAGTIIDTQIGFSMVNVIDPQTNSQIPIMGNFYNILITLIFLGVNGHHLIIRALVHSYKILPLGGRLSISMDFIIQITAIFREVFHLSIRLSAPVLITIFLANVLLGILARTMPQMNIFIVGMPLKIGVGIVTILITLRLIVPFSQKLFEVMFEKTYEIIQILARG